ncbi:cytochrome P450 [Lactarius quietus]|nr:cytochrome P450 [Lactarius quietus]
MAYQGCLTALTAILIFSACRILYNLYLHPLSRFPGPKLAACSRLWLAYRELIKGESLGDLRAELHRQYGEIIRLTPDELHFSNPAAYSDIYNPRNKWDKDNLLYRAFDMNMATVGFIRYADAKQRRDVLSPLFSRTSILQMQDLIKERVNVLCDALAHQYAPGKSSDLVMGFHCFSIDVIMAFCFAKNLDATKAPDFKSDIIFASQAVLPILTVGKYSGILLKTMRHTPLWFGKRYGSPVYTNQIDEILRNPVILEDAPHKIIYHSLLDAHANKGRALPSRLSLGQEAGALVNAGSDTTSISATTITYHVLHNPEVHQRLVKELLTAWPVLEEVPRYEVLEKLPFLAKGLRMFPGGFTLPRVVPPEGATISGTFIPGGTVVGQCTLRVHRSPAVFSDPDTFIPDRWLGEDAKTYEPSMVAFSKGPRSCIGINLAYCELYLVIAGIFRRFDMTLDAERSGDLSVVEHFVPVFKGPHLHAYCKPVLD